MRYLLLFTAMCTLISAPIVNAESTADRNKTVEEHNKEFPGIKTLMSAQEWQAAGLTKLSDSELDALNAWLIRYTARDASILRNQVTQIKEEADKDIHSNIDGKFSGWSGKTRFRLKNGQVWQQRHNGRWKTELVDPEVIITRNFFGFYEMKVKVADRSIGVKRLE